MIAATVLAAAGDRHPQLHDCAAGADPILPGDGAF